ncbi:MAG: alcohol dehydrogenase [Geminicoccaceae bacterium]|nr:alcohol dehydrogenase [Geminicoccaceae bacterium]MCS7269195.1 alcohol dehydrogenase [Geminicoccaceae bacterium]MDW8125605.1 alcohol dehydrogenase [Geminicoccaceae bacterium]MDW8342310.1 alcohol dehydrogenase [Geminicoccaceae bacterium]
MRSWQIIRWGEPLEPRDYPDPVPEGRQVVLRVLASGICHSDLHIWQGYFDLGGGERLDITTRGIQLPFTLGHEVLGEVVAVGPDVHEVRPGDRRIVYPWIGCGGCPDCARGDELLCPRPRVVGTWRDGGYSTHVLVPDARYLVPYDGLDPAVACTYACSGVTALSALKKTGLRRDDQTLLLVGCGGVGLQALQMARAVVRGRIAVAEPDAKKREAARAAGADAVIDNSDPKAAVQAVKDFSGGGADAAIDFVGRPETARFALDSLRPKGGTLVVVGLYGDRLVYPLPLFPLRVLTVRGSYVGTLDDLRDVVRFAREGRLPPLPVTRVPLEKVNEAMADLAAGRITGRIVLVP